MCSTPTTQAKSVPELCTTSLPLSISLYRSHPHPHPTQPDQFYNPMPAGSYLIFGRSSCEISFHSFFTRLFLTIASYWLLGLGSMCVGGGLHSKHVCKSDVVFGRTDFLCVLFTFDATHHHTFCFLFPLRISRWWWCDVADIFCYFFLNASPTDAYIQTHTETLCEWNLCVDGPPGETSSPGEINNKNQ